MTIDNFSILEPLLDFGEPDDFYFIEIMQRKKDFPEHTQNVDAKIVKSLYIYSLEEWNRKKNDIKDICKKFNARAYIWLIKRNCKDVCLFAIQELARYVHEANCQRAYRIWDHCVGKIHGKGPKYWVIDFDSKDASLLYSVVTKINQCKSKQMVNVVAISHTKNGYHIVTNPFDLRQLFQNDNCTMLKIEDIKKDSPTLLYYENNS